MTVKTAKINLKEPSSDNPTLIFLIVHCDDRDPKTGKLNRAKISTGEKIHPKYLQNGQIQVWQDKHLLQPIHDAVNKLQGEIGSYLRYLKTEGKQVIKEDIIKRFNKNSRSQNVIAINSNTYFFQWYEDLLRDMSTGKEQTQKRRKFSDGTIKNYYLNLDRLKSFNEKIHPDVLTPETVEKFRVWMIETKTKKGNDISFNYVEQHVGMWGDILQRLYKKKLHHNTIFRDDCFVARSENVELPYLTEQEVLRLYEHQCTSQAQELKRDRWMILCCTGLRVSDSIKLEFRHIDYVNKIIHLMNEKTKEISYAPFHEITVEILHKYKGLPPSFHETVLNREIKEIARDAGIIDEHIYTKTVGGVKQEFSQPKWQLITNHTGRRTCITNMQLNGITFEQGAKIVGMKGRSTWDRYGKATVIDKIKKLANNPAFKKLKAV